MMQSYLVVCRLDPPPAGKLSPWGGLLDVADEHGLLAYAIGEDGVRALPSDMLWGRFDTAAAALAALDASIAGASELLGYPIQARGRLACPIEAAALPATSLDSDCSGNSSSISSEPLGFLKLMAEGDKSR